MNHNEHESQEFFFVVFQKLSQNMFSITFGTSEIHLIKNIIKPTEIESIHISLKYNINILIGFWCIVYFLTIWRWINSLANIFCNHRHNYHPISSKIIQYFFLKKKHSKIFYHLLLLIYEIDYYIIIHMIYTQKMIDFWIYISVIWMLFFFAPRFDKFNEYLNILLLLIIWWRDSIFETW